MNNNKDSRLKNFLKRLKLNESAISMVLGILVLIVVGVLAFKYFKGLNQTGVVSDKGIQTETATGPVGGKHTVSKGETLWSISEKYYGTGFNWVDIADENDLQNPDLIAEGTEISIPNVEPKQLTTTKEGNQKTTGDKYTVVKGDTLWDIAQQVYGDAYLWTKIARENHLVNPDLIHPGNEFRIPR